MKKRFQLMPYRYQNNIIVRRSLKGLNMNSPGCNPGWSGTDDKGNPEGVEQLSPMMGNPFRVV
jgi:hypothetical protein